MSVFDCHLSWSLYQACTLGISREETLGRGPYSWLGWAALLGHNVGLDEVWFRTFWQTDWHTVDCGWIHVDSAGEWKLKFLWFYHVLLMCLFHAVLVITEGSRVGGVVALNLLLDHFLRAFDLTCRVVCRHVMKRGPDLFCLFGLNSRFIGAFLASGRLPRLWLNSFGLFDLWRLFGQCDLFPVTVWMRVQEGFDPSITFGQRLIIM